MEIYVSNYHLGKPTGPTLNGLIKSYGPPGRYNKSTSDRRGQIVELAFVQNSGNLENTIEMTGGKIGNMLKLLGPDYKKVSLEILTQNGKVAAIVVPDKPRGYRSGNGNYHKRLQEIAEKNGIKFTEYPGILLDGKPISVAPSYLKDYCLLCKKGVQKITAKDRKTIGKNLAIAVTNPPTSRKSGENRVAGGYYHMFVAQIATHLSLNGNVRAIHMQFYR